VLGAGGAIGRAFHAGVLGALDVAAGIDALAEKLASITFIAGAGSFADKSDRLVELVQELGGDGTAVQAAKLAKADQAAELVREFLPDAQITFDKETGGKELSGNYLIDNTRLVQEFGVQYRPYRERVLQIINDIRREEGLPLVSDR